MLNSNIRVFFINCYCTFFKNIYATYYCVKLLSNLGVYIPAQIIGKLFKFLNLPLEEYCWLNIDLREVSRTTLSSKCTTVSFSRDEILLLILIVSQKYSPPTSRS